MMHSFLLYRWLLVGFVALVLASFIFWLSLRPSHVPSRLGMRGLKRQKALLRSPTWASIEPFVRFMSMRVGGLLSVRARAKLDAQLLHAGDYLGLSPEEYFACTVTSALVGLGAGALIGGVVFQEGRGVMPALVGAMIGALVPNMIVDGARVSRFQAINRGLPYAIDMMALSMSAGLDFPSALQQVVVKAKANEAMREELAYLLQQLNLGSTRSQALRELAARVPIEAVRELVEALVQAEDRGNPVAAVLEAQAATSRTRRSNTAENVASAMRTKLTIPIMILIGISLALVAVPSSMMLERLTSDPTGMGM